MLADWIIGIHLFTQHQPQRYTARGSHRYESFTPGLYGRSASGMTLGAYRNSYGDASAYAGWTFETNDRRWALLVAGVVGYKRSPLLPLVVPSVRFSIDDQWAWRIAATPKPPGSNGGAAMMHLTVERQFQP